MPSKGLAPSQVGSMAESFLHYWQIVSAAPNTRWLESSSSELNSEPRWPGVFKGNVVVFGESPGVVDRHFPGTGQRIARKVCMHALEQESESAWMKFEERFPAGLGRFRPVSTRGSARDPDELWGRVPIVMEKVDGVSLFDIASLLNAIGRDEVSCAVASRVLGEIVYDSLCSLASFREAADSIVSPAMRRPYSYSNQLCKALDGLAELGDPVVGTLAAEAREDALCMGRMLQSRTSVPFRDAHLKNRVWSTHESARKLVQRLLLSDMESVRREMHESVFDIDFETTFLTVTQWDDVIHILFFEMSGTDPSLEPDAVSSYEYWWGAVGDTEGMLATALARSTRELCRRIWYAQNMPNSYWLRYGYESRNYFLDLALWSASGLGQFSRLRQLLLAIQDCPHVWGRIDERFHPTLRAVLPPDCRPVL